MYIYIYIYIEKRRYVMRKNAEEYGVRGIVKATPSLHVNGEQSSVTAGSCQNAPPPSVLHGPPPEKILLTLFL